MPDFGFSGISISGVATNCHVDLFVVLGGELDFRDTRTHNQKRIRKFCKEARVSLHARILHHYFTFSEKALKVS